MSEGPQLEGEFEPAGFVGEEEPEPGLEETPAGERHELEDQEPEQVTGPPQFNYNDRLYALGYSGTGKSELLNVIFSGLGCQRLLIDTKPEFRIPDLAPVHTPEAIDWTAPLIHYQPSPGSDSSQYEEIFAMAFTRRGLCVLVHEFGALVDYNANRAGRYTISYASQGRALGLGLLAGTTRPVCVPVAGRTEANHIVVFAPQLAEREDNVAAASALSPVNGAPLDRHELVAELGGLQAEHGQYACLWKDRNSGRLIALPPLPDHLRSLSIVERIEDA